MVSDAVFIDDCLRALAIAQPEATAVVCGDRRVSYRDLERRVDGLATQLIARGVAPGDRVAVLGHPCLEVWCSVLATARIGGIWVGMNPKYRIQELGYLVKDCCPALVLSDGSIGEATAAELEDILGGLPRRAGLLSLTELCATRSTGTGQSEVRRVARAPGDAVALVYTSGSSGRPKGAVLSHQGLTCGARMQIAHLGIARQSLVVSFPINHVACLADTCSTTMMTGGKIVFHQRFDPLRLLQDTAQERCNMLGGVPTMLQLLLDEPAFDDLDLSSLELIAWGGAAMPRQYIERLRGMGVRLLTLYGLTETSANIVFGDASQGTDALAETIGVEDHCVACRIVDERGAVCAPQTPGELQFKADFFFIGYWQREDETQAAWTADGWFRSGDIGYRREDGRLVLCGRRSDMFKSGGYNVYPREVERVLEALPGVAATAVVGVPDALFQEVGLAYLEAHEGCVLDEESIRAACAERLANYKVPKHFRFVKALPLLPVGKVDKARLREQAREFILSAGSAAQGV